MRRAALGLASALVTALALSGCGMAVTPAVESTGSASPVTAAPVTPLDRLHVLADPGAYQGPSTATLHIGGLPAPASAPSQNLPVTVTSHDRSGDREVTVTDASRVVVADLAGSIGDTVWALGLADSIVGRDVAVSFPGSEDVPVVTGGGHAINAEAVLALRPTLVISDGSVGPTTAIDQLRDVGVTVVYVDNVSSFDGAAQLARDVAAVLGVPDAGETLARSLAEAVETVRAQVDAIAPSTRLRMVFVYLRGSASVYYLFGEESGADQLIDALDGVDAAGEMGIRGEQPLTDEAMLAADPDVILVMTDGLASVGGVDGLMRQFPAIALTTAGKNRRVVDMADTQILSFGPRSAAVLDGLARAIYAPES